MMRFDVHSALRLCLVVSALVAVESAAHAELLVANPGGGFGASVKKFNSTTGAFLQSFASGEEIEGLAIGPNGNLYLAQNTLGFGGVDQYNWQTGAFINTLVPLNTGDTVPYGLTFGPDGNVYLSSNKLGNFGTTAVLRYNGITGAPMGTFVPTGSGGLTQTYDVDFGPDGKLYVTDGGPAWAGSAVRRYDGVTGAFLDQLPMTDPGGMAFANGLVYVSSGAGNSVLRFNISNGAFVDTFVTSGSGGLTSPTDLAFGPDGNLYIVSSGNQSVLRYNGNTGAFIDTFVTSGSGGMNAPTFMLFTDIPEPTSALGALVVAMPMLRSFGRRTRR